MDHPVIARILEKLESRGLLPLEKQAALEETLLGERLALLPDLMKETGLSCWLVLAQENNEDPAMKALMTWDRRTARRQTALLFFRQGDQVRALSWGMPSQVMAKFYTPSKEGDETLCQGLARLFKQYDPQQIGVNMAPQAGGFCDGLSAGLYQMLEEELPAPWRNRLCSAGRLSTRFLETMTAGEHKVMETLVEVTEDIIKAAYSPDVIVPGQTTTQDVEWFMRHVMAACQLDFWFGPDVDLQRQGLESLSNEGVIQPGDLLHCDIGVMLKYIPVLTDKQWMAYVRRPGETAPPQGLEQLFSQCGRFQEITRSHFLSGIPGNQVFHKAVDQGKAEGLCPQLYCHGLGVFGHGPGPIIGRYDYQDSIYPRGEYPVGLHSSHALELNVRGKVPEWNDQVVRISLEEDVHIGETCEYVYHHQEKLIII